MNAICKKLLSLVLVLAMVLTLTPVITLPAAAEETTDTRSHPVTEAIAAGATEIWCDHCDAMVAADKWVSLATFAGDSNYLHKVTDAAYSADSGIHIYVPNDITDATKYIVYFSGTVFYNLHLNGYNLTAEADPAIGLWGNLNIIGDGVITGYTTNSYYGSAIHSNATSAKTVNLYGGTYNSAEGSSGAAIGSGARGMNVNVLSDSVTINDTMFLRMSNTTDSYGYAPSQFYFKAGTLNGGISVYVTDAYTLTEPVIKIENGTFNGEYLLYESNAGVIDATVEISGGTFNHTKLYGKNQSAWDATPVITGGTFSWDPTSYVSGCNAATKTDSVWTVALSHNYVDGVCTKCQAKEPDLPAFELDADGYAYCEACYKLALEGGSSREDALTAAWKQWEAYDGQWFGANTGEYYTGDHIHYYLDSDKTFDHTQHFMYTKGRTCLNLNGHTITPIDPETGKAPTAGNNAGGCTLTTTSRLYIMDSSEKKTGKVVGKIGDEVTDGAAIRLNWASARCYLFGGTFTRQQPAEAAACRPVLAAATNGGKFYMYDGVTVDGTGLSNTTGTTCVYLGGTAAEEELAQFNMYGGEIIGGEATDANGGAITVGPASTGYAEFNLYGGEIHGGTAVNGGNIYVKNGTVNMEGGKIYGGSTPTSGGNVYVDTNGVLNMSGGEMYGTAYDPNDATPAYDAKNAGNLYIYKGGVANLSGTAVVRDGSASSQAGNVYLSSTARLNMSGSAEIRGGVAATRGGNIRAYVSTGSANRPVITMAGNSKVYGGFAARLNSEGVLQSSNEHNIWIGNGDLIMKDNATIHGYIRQDGVIATKSAIALTSGSRLVLDGNASIVNQTGTSNQIADVGATDTLIVTKDWKGTVYLNSCTVDAETSKITGPVASCGTFNYETLEATKDETATGTFTGKLYYYNNGNSPIMARNGDLYTAALGVVSGDNESFYTDVTEAMTDYASKENAILKAYANTTLAMTDDVRMDLNGKTVEASGTGKLYAMDSGNDDYEGGGKLTVANTVDVVRDVVDSASGKRYINVTTAKGDGTQTISSYRVKMDLDTVTLRAGKTDERNGLYYKVKLSMGENLSNKVTTYGVVLSLKDMPRDNFLTEGNQNGFTAMEDAVGVSSENGYTVTLNSGAVFGIMKTSVPVLPAGYDTLADYNAARGKMSVYANAYLEIDADGDGIGEFYMAEVEGDDIAWSMHDVLYAIDGRWSDFAAAQQKLTEFYSFWHEYGMNQWTFTNIKKA